jgi:hypothetical protein
MIERTRCKSKGPLITFKLILPFFFFGERKGDKETLQSICPASGPRSKSVISEYE